MAETETGVTNIPELTVSELAGALKRTLEDRFGYVRIRGEISGYRGPHSSGHAYFSIKDETARIDAVVWRQTFARMKVKPEEGMEVVASGKITTFPGKSTYQIVVESLAPAGVGALMALLEKRRRLLAAEGLFDAARKRPLPYLPRVVGVVTSPTGAVIRDILHRLADRFPVHVVLWPVRVQGEGSAEEIAAAIAGMNARDPASPFPRPDVLIVARGGGSLEDLWSFNEEAVVRAAAASEIPLVAAVGHETDWTLIDHVADMRAPTPTAAAELCVPVRAELIARLARLDARGLGAVQRYVQQRGTALRALLRGRPSPKEACRHAAQRLDAAFDAATARARALLGAKAIRLANAGARLQRQSPSARLGVAAERIRATGAKLAFARQADFRRRAERARALAQRFEARGGELARLPAQWRREVERTAARLKRALEEGMRGRRAAAARSFHVFEAVNYRAVLARGFAIVLDGPKSVVTRAEAARGAKALTIRFADGDVGVVPVDRPRAGRRRPGAPAQEDLFAEPGKD